MASKMPSVLLLLLLVCTSAASAHTADPLHDSTVRGVALDAQQLFQRDAFECIVRGTRQLLPRERVNDDYCDCDDGADEPGTAACSHVLDHTFFCYNDGYFPKQIPTSRVDDSVCDCCDGSDEPATHCSNTCATDAIAYRDAARTRLAIVQRGVAKRAAAIAATVEPYFDDATAASAATVTTLDALQTLRSRIVALKDREERFEARMRLAHARAAQTSLGDTDATAAVETDTIAAASACAVDDATCSSSSDSDNEDAALSLEALDAHDVVDDADDAVEVAANELPVQSLDDEDGVNNAHALTRQRLLTSSIELRDGTKVSLSDYLRMEQQTRRSNDRHASKKQKQTPDHMRRFGFLGPLFHGDAVGRQRILLFALRTVGVVASPLRFVYEVVSFVPRTLVDLVVTAFKIDLQHLYPYTPTTLWHTHVVHALWFRRLADGAVASTYHGVAWSVQVVWDAPVFVYSYLFPRLDASIESPEAASLRRVVQEIDDDIRTLESQHNVKRDAAAFDYGLERAFYALDSRTDESTCLKQQIDKYTYSFCAFQQVKQDATLLGTWHAWGTTTGDDKDYTRMHYTNGQSCWNGPQRSVRVTLECSDESALVSVDEPATCEYDMVVRSPLACTPAVLADAQREVTFWQRE